MNNWTEQQLKEVLALYCQIPFGRLHRNNPDIIKLSNKIERSPSAVAMKMCNFASLDPAIFSSGRKGLHKVSALDKRVWDKFQNDWDALLEDYIFEDEIINGIDHVHEDDTTKGVEIEVRKKQYLFRKIVLLNYNSCCCISGLKESILLVASHIIPWSISAPNRLNPRNGLCLSVLHDKAFDQGLIAILPNYTIAISEKLKRNNCDSFMASTILDLEGKKINLPDKFYPDPMLLKWHFENIFQCNK